mmetsp:Transcript_4497/g.6798  ORF Transcript_4497/g.6798 Transcript_4497/m.6798 type:complete len:797 (-) Transcript_4497:129-2519(-)
MGGKELKKHAIKGEDDTDDTIPLPPPTTTSKSSKSHFYKKKNKKKKKVIKDTILVYIPMNVSADLGIAMRRTRAKRLAKFRKLYPELQKRKSSEIESEAEDDEEKVTGKDGKEQEEQDEMTPKKKRPKIENDTKKDDIMLNWDQEDEDGIRIPKRDQYGSVLDYLEAKYVRGVMIPDFDEEHKKKKKKKKKSSDDDDDDDDNDDNESSASSELSGGPGSCYSDESGEFIDDSLLRAEVAEQVVASSAYGGKTKIEQRMKEKLKKKKNKKQKKDSGDEENEEDHSQKEIISEDDEDDYDLDDEYDDNDNDGFFVNIGDLEMEDGYEDLDVDIDYDELTKPSSAKKTGGGVGGGAGDLKQKKKKKKKGSGDTNTNESKKKQTSPTKKIVKKKKKKTAGDVDEKTGDGETNTSTTKKKKSGDSTVSGGKRKHPSSSTAATPPTSNKKKSKLKQSPKSLPKKTKKLASSSASTSSSSKSGSVTKPKKKKKKLIKTDSSDNESSDNDDDDDDSDNEEKETKKKIEDSSSSSSSSDNDNELKSVPSAKVKNAKTKTDQFKKLMKKLYKVAVEEIKKMTEENIPLKPNAGGNGKTKKGKKMIKVSLIIPPNREPGDDITFNNPHVPGQKLQVKVPSNGVPGQKFVVKVPAPEVRKTTTTATENKFTNEVKIALDTYSQVYDDWCMAEAFYRQLIPHKGRVPFKPATERLKKFDEILKEFPKDMLFPIDAAYLRKVVRRNRQNVKKRVKTQQYGNPASLLASGNMTLEEVDEDCPPQTLELCVPGKGTCFSAVKFNLSDFKLRN